MKIRIAAALLLALGAVGTFLTADVASSHWSQWWPWASRTTAEGGSAPPTYPTPEHGSSQDLAKTVPSSARPNGKATTSSTARPRATKTSKPTTSSPNAKSLRVYVSAYGYWDNNPPGSGEISNPIMHSSAGGTGTYDDPVTAAVPYHCAGGCLEWPAGTRFYLASLKRYAIVEDTCGDRGPNTCDDTNGSQLVVWVGRSSTARAASACEDNLTGTATAIENPASDLAVTPGDIC